MRLFQVAQTATLLMTLIMLRTGSPASSASWQIMLAEQSEQLSGLLTLAADRIDPAKKQNRLMIRTLKVLLVLIIWIKQLPNTRR